jgi:hypothetical protein
MGVYYIQRDCWFSRQFLILYFLAPFHFPTEIHLSLRRSSRRDEKYLRRSSQSLHRIRGRSPEGLNESDDQQGCVSLKD